MDDADAKLPPALLQTLPADQATLWDAYVEGLKTRPILYKAGTSGTLNGLQEVIATLATGSKLDIFKPARMAAYGFFISGPLGHALYDRLEKIFDGKKGAGWTLAKLLASNLVISPILNTAYLIAMGLIAGQNLATSIRNARARLPSVMRTSWIVFPAVQTLAFRYVPPALWLPLFNLVAFTFGLYININAKLAAKRKRIEGGEDKKGK
ncbi:hypothetical protein HDV05_003354 [Chytridiales sp. JEL 0842]|nr:hypothetical protein HDV05_003354 [Chytridiales sp. JEL 0842]